MTSGVKSAKLLGKERVTGIAIYIPYNNSEFLMQGREKLSVYLEYVSGASIDKLLLEYGPFEEPVIQSYTRQILSGLAYLHGRNTVHRLWMFQVLVVMVLVAYTYMEERYTVHMLLDVSVVLAVMVVLVYSM